MCACVCICTCISIGHTYKQISVFVGIESVDFLCSRFSELCSEFLLRACACVCKCVYICMCVHVGMCVRVCVYVYVYVHLHRTHVKADVCWL